MSRRTKKLTRAFVRNFPGDHADHRVVAKSTKQVLSAMPATSAHYGEGESERSSANNATPVVTKLVHDYLSELDSFYVTKFHRIETNYKRVALYRELHKFYITAKNADETKAMANRHKLDVSLTSYNLALEENLPSLTQLMDKRYVAFKAVRVAYWSAQLRAFDSIRDSLTRNMGVICEPAIEKLDEASEQLRNFVNSYVERLAAINIKNMSPTEIECYIPTAELDDSCEHSFHKMISVPTDPRFTTPPPSKNHFPGGGERIFRVFSPKGSAARRINSRIGEHEMAPRNLSMPPSRASPLSVEPSHNRASLPMDDFKFGLHDDSNMTPMSPVSSLDGNTTIAARSTNEEDEIQAVAKRVLSTPRRRAVNVPWLRRKFEHAAEV